MIQIEFEEHCPFCHEEVELQLEDGMHDEVEYTCECGATMLFGMAAKTELTWTPK